MFGFLKEKIKNAVSSMTKKVEEEAEVVKTPVEQIKEKLKKVEPKKKESKTKKQKKIEIEPKLKEEPKKVVKEKPKEEKKSFFGRIAEKVTTKKISEKQFEEFFFELELALLENNVALEVIDKIKEDLKMDLVDVPLKRGDIAKQIMDSLKKSVDEILNVPKLSLLSEVKKNKPYKILFLGYNGVGKSLSVARVAQYFKTNGLRPVLAAGDTFRAAAVAQLEEYGKQVGVPVIKHQQGSDACAVIYDSIESAKAKGMDVVLADSAGRIHSNNDLMQELKKIVSKNKFDLKVLVIEATVGSDVVDQVKEFDRIVGVDALIITKNDVYEKGGSLLSACYLLQKPILFLGVGQGMDDLKEYDAEEVASNMF